MADQPTYKELEQRIKDLEQEATEHNQTKQALRLERDKVKNFLDVAGVIIVVIGANQKVSLINRRGCEVLGYEANEIQGKNWFDNFLPERVKEDLRSGFVELMAAPQKDIDEIFEHGGENPILTKGGKERIIAWRNTVLKDEEGNITATMSSGEDVTEARRTEKALRKSEERFRSFLDKLGDVVYEADFNGVITYANKRAEEITGMAMEDILGTDFLPLFTEASQKVAVEVFQRTLEGETPEYELTFINGKIGYFKNEPLTDENQKIVGLCSVVRDITDRKRVEEALQKAHDELEMRVEEPTAELLKINEHLEREIEERKHAEEALRKSEERFRAMFEHIGSGVAVYEAAENGKDFIFRDFNSSAERITRISRNTALGGRLLDLFPHMDRSGLLGALQRVWKTGQAEHLPPFYYKDKIREGWRENRIYKLPSGEVVAIFDDVTERKLAEEAMRKSEIRYRTLVENIEMGITLINKDHSILMTNKAQGKLFKKSPSDFVGKKCYREFENREQICEHCPGTQAMTTGQPSYIQTEGVLDDGSRFTADIHAFPFIETNGKISGFIEVVQDITEIKRAEEALNRASRELNQIFNTAVPLCVIDKDYNMLRVNDTFCSYFGMNRNEVVGNKCYKIWQGPLCDKPECPLRQILSGMERSEYEVDKKLSDGKTVSCVVTAIPYRGLKGELIGVVENFTDITWRKQAEQEKKELEIKLFQAQKMEAIGTLAGGIAHDFNNLLMAILGNVSFMLYEIDFTHPYYESLKSIKNEVKSGAELTKQLLGYARKGQYYVQPINLNPLVEQTSEAFGRTRKDILIDRDLAEDIFAIEADQGQIEQVLMNLLVNCGDAMPSGGELVLRTANVSDKDIKDIKVKEYDAKPGNYVELTVSDTGTGMDEETLDRIFDPFFTTKEMGRGTGLGLASVYGIIKGHSGYIDVESKIGRGTTFTVYLPATEKKIKEAVKPTEGIVKGNETILMVDDEDRVLDIGIKVLKRLGYTVLEAKSGKEAVEVYKDNKDEIDLVILDIVMPVMGGGEAYDRMKEINPNVKVLLSSGYSIDSHAKEILARGCDAFIQKPFGMRELSQRIREILEKK